MSFTIKPFEQVLAEIAVTIAVATASTPGAKDTRAQAALKAAAALQPIAAGNFSQSLAQLESLVTSSDPGVTQLVQDIFAIANTFIGPLLVAETQAPGLAALIEGITTNVIAGVTAVASAYPAPTVVAPPSAPAASPPATGATSE